MRKFKFLSLSLTLLLLSSNLFAADLFPDGTPISDWFRDTKIVDYKTLGEQYVITDHGVKNDSNILQTKQIQAVIDRAAESGGGVIIIPKGTFLSSSLFFKPKTHLYLEAGAVLKGSDDISDFPIMETRIEGETCPYFPALINADKVDGFTISGNGTVNGNGLRYWKAFWLRRAWNPKCTNKDEMRPRLLFVSNSNDVQISGITFKDSPFWQTHFYKCNNLKLLGLTIISPKEPVKSPSTDAIDLDVCTNVLVKNCFMQVNDDAIALKGGKGPVSDKDPNNGGNYNILIEDNTYGFCHSALTCGSESIHNRNILFRRSELNGAQIVLHLKMRPDTPQNYEYITVEDISGTAGKFISIRPWTQFFDLKGEKTPPPSRSSNIVMRNIEVECTTFFDVTNSDKYKLSNFTFENLKIKTQNRPKIEKEYFDGVVVKNVVVNGVSL
ncbi:MAG: exopolygalacturonase [Porphyromonadaceae bacterium]|nr:exopolygalacturonase [Porphyromonadaceae bacterium]